MMRLIRFLTLPILICFLIACATSELTQDEKSEPAVVETHALFDAWNDASISNAAVAKLIKQADIMIKYKQWDDAQGKLERTLRVATNYAPAWSRLSWLSLRAAKHNKAIQLAHRSNTHTQSSQLQRLNWSFIRDANKLLGNSDAATAASKMIDRLEGGGL